MWQTDVVFYLVMIVIFVIIVILAVLAHAGFFHEVRVRMAAPNVFPRHFAYIVKTGPYKNCGEVFKTLAKLAPKKTLFGIYYDDPDMVRVCTYWCPLINVQAAIPGPEFCSFFEQLVKIQYL